MQRFFTRIDNHQGHVFDFGLNYFSGGKFCAGKVKYLIRTILIKDQSVLTQGSTDGFSIPSMRDNI